MTPHYEGLLGNKQLGVGAVDVQDPKVESGETVAARIRAYKWLAPEQTIITSSCGFNHLPRQHGATASSRHDGGQSASSAAEDHARRGSAGSIFSATAMLKQREFRRGRRP